MPTVRLNLQSAYLPFLSTYIGDNVLRSTELDKNFVVRNRFVGAEQQDKDIGIPMPTYGENILPTSLGWESVSYSVKVPSKANATFDQIFNLKSGTENNVLYSPSHGKNYISYAGSWVEGPPSTNFSGMVTVAYTKLRSFIFFQKQKVLEYNFSDKGFYNVTLAGLDIKNIDGITAANNALIAWNETTIFWSSFLDPVDFTPSLSSGAGSQNPTQVRGKIVACLPAADGFIIYTTANAIFVSWTDNIRFPWKFTEIKGSSGITSPEHVTYEANYDGHFAWTVNGLQLVTRTGAKPVFTELTDFLTGNLVEEYIGPTPNQSHVNLAGEFNSGTQTWLDKVGGPQLTQQIKLSKNPWVKLSFIGARYFILSYGYREEGIYDWAVVYDTSLDRYGKLKIRHVDAFNYVTQSNEEFTVKDSIGFLQQNGQIRVVDFSLPNKGLGILIYGRLREAHGKWIELSDIDIQTVKEDTPSLVLFPTYDGLNPETPEFPFLALDTRNKKHWNSRLAGANVSLMFAGSFSITSLEVTFKPLGDR